MLQFLPLVIATQTPSMHSFLRPRLQSIAGLLSGVGALLLGLTLASGPLFAAPTTTVIAEDSFSYANNISVVGQNGGTGWTSAWLSDSLSFTDFFTNSAGLSIPGLTGAGGKLVFYFAGSPLNDATRSLPLQNSGVVYVQFLSQFGAQSGFGTPNIRFFNSDTLTGAVGNNGFCGGPVYAILNSGLEAIAASCSTVSLSLLRAVVLRIDYASNTTQMWALSDLSGFDYFNPPAPSAVYAGLAPAFNRIALYTRDPASIDELKILRVNAEPSSPQAVPGLSGATLGLLSVLVALGALLRHLRRARG